MARETPEWIGKNDDQKVPARVRQRVFDRENGICHLTGKKIQPSDEWDLDHRLALILGGEHRESNFYPALRDAHRKKTASEMTVKSKIANVRKKHLGIGKEPTMPGSRNSRFKKLITGEVVDRSTGEVIGGSRP
ncbi:hypothetical protein GCM10011491_30330 [Brucella endophytica]|uniref:HNH endonuclease n=1 Tax=Brucella endophytica TaxID=1963359 RepID=A0A916SJY4_9HYPH|nr:HNH endonuclease [Brucella endophytica]GGB00024.1 hypothetical protein GCM10011491_30330 [Brucella endophytica]